VKPFKSKTRRKEEEKGIVKENPKSMRTRTTMKMMTNLLLK